MTKQEIIDELNAGRHHGYDNWSITPHGRFRAGCFDERIFLSPAWAHEAAEAIRRNREALSLDAVMPMLEAIVDYGDGWGADPEMPVGLYIDGDSLLDLHRFPTKHGDVRAVVEAWKAMRR